MGCNASKAATGAAISAGGVPDGGDPLKKPALPDGHVSVENKAAAEAGTATTSSPGVEDGKKDIDTSSNRDGIPAIATASTVGTSASMGGDGIGPIHRSSPSVSSKHDIPSPSNASCLSTTSAAVPYTMLILRNRLVETQSLRESNSDYDDYEEEGIDNLVGTTDPLEDSSFWSSVMESLNATQSNPHELALLRNYVDPHTGSTPLHEALKLSNQTFAVIKVLIQATGGQSVLECRDRDGNIPMHYAIVGPGDGRRRRRRGSRVPGEVVQFLIDSHPEVAHAYLSLSHGRDLSKSTSPLYQAIVLQRENNVLQNLHAAAPEMLCQATRIPRDTGSFGGRNMRSTSQNSAGGGGSSSSNLLAPGCYDTPMALLWRRYHSFKFQSEKFFPGDNSHPSVTSHRLRFRQLATETRDAIMNMLQVLNSGRIVHAVASLASVAPVDLIQVILVKNPNEIGEVDESGRLPLHYAAMSVAGIMSGNADALQVGEGGGYQGKFVVETLLKLCPSAARVKDSQGKTPLAYAVEGWAEARANSTAARTATGGGGDDDDEVMISPNVLGVIAALYRAHPEGIENAAQFVDKWAVQFVLEHVSKSDDDDEEGGDDENDTGMEMPLGEAVASSAALHHSPLNDAVFVVQRADATPSDIVGAMWAHRNDAGLQMLSLVALSKLAKNLRDSTGPTKVALAGGVAATVHAMAAHPTESIVQEKACEVLRRLSVVNGRYELCLASLGAVAAIVRSMQDNPDDAPVQKEAIAALGALGGATPGPRGGGRKARDAYMNIVSSGGVAAIVHAMEAHPDDEGVQLESCRALEGLSAHSTDDVPLHSSVEELYPLLMAAATSFDGECKESADFVMKKLKKRASATLTADKGRSDAATDGAADEAEEEDTTEV